MSFIGNVIWLVFGGFLAGVIYVIGGVLLHLTIIGIPFGRQAIRFGMSVMLPFGKQVTEQPGSDNPLSLIFNLLWLVLFGWETALTHLTFGVILAVTVVGWPFAKKHFQLIPVSLFPFTYTLSPVNK